MTTHDTSTHTGGRILLFTGASGRSADWVADAIANSTLISVNCTEVVSIVSGDTAELIFRWTVVTPPPLARVTLIGPHSTGTSAWLAAFVTAAESVGLTPAPDGKATLDVDDTTSVASFTVRDELGGNQPVQGGPCLLHRLTT